MKLKFTEAGCRKSEVRNLTSRGRSPASERGVALIVTLLMLSIITFMTVTFLFLARSEKGSVVTATEQSTARYAADDALERAKADILGPILAFNNDQQYDLRVSTNFINGAGFLSGLSSFENVSYNYPNGAPLSTADLEQNLANLLYDPRPPVIVVTNRITGASEFRFYLDLNRNGRFDPSGQVPLTGPNGGFLHPNGSEDPSPVNVVSNFVVGDPEWIGVLEHPDQPQSASNRFLARFAYVVIPAGKTLDINYNHNQALDIQNGNPTINPPQNADGYLRNEGVGSWEVNLAAFLADLNTNAWNNPFNGSGIYNYQQPLGFGNTGASFDDARALLAYRYASNYTSLQRVFSLFGPNGGAALLTDGIDQYDDGPLQTNTALLPENERNAPWLGADNPNHFFTHQELFDPNKTAIGVGPVATNFTGRLSAVGTGLSTYDRYTFYRMLAQLGTDSAPESGKINVNYLNVDANGNVVPGMETNFISWSDPRIPLSPPGGLGYGRPGSEVFFTAAALAMFKQLNLHDLNTNLITITNIPVYPVNFYTPAVHRVLQLAANIYDATTNRDSLTGYPYLPSVFRPVLRRNANNIVSIVGYEEVTDATMAGIGGAAPPMLDLSMSGNVSGILPVGTPFELVNVEPMVMGIPVVVGAKKGFPNFNELAMQNSTTVTRRLNFQRPYGQAVNQTNQDYYFSISNAFGIGAWNSYAAAFPRSLQMSVATDVTMFVTNENRALVLSNWFSTGAFPVTTNIPPNTWPGLSTMKIPMLMTYSVTNAEFVQNRGFVASGTDPNNLFPVPHLWLNLRTRLLYCLVDTSVTPHRIVDYVNLSFSADPLSLMDTLINGAPCTATVGSDVGVFWCTNRWGAPMGMGGDTPGAWPTITYGILNQINVSAGNPQPVGDNIWRNGSSDDEFTAIQGFVKHLSATNSGTNASDMRFAAPFAPSRTINRYVSWQANDPLVHYTIPDLTDLLAITNTLELDTGDNSPLLKISQVPRIGHYRPWGFARFSVPDTAPQTSTRMVLKDPLVTGSDSWDFPGNKFPNIGWLGRVHRGTPWQTVYLKSSAADANTWQKWTGDTVVMTNFAGTNLVLVQDYPLSTTANDWKLFDLFTAAVNENATRGQLSINQKGLAAWSAVLSSVIALPNTNNFVVISPAGADTNSALWQIVNGANGINATRAATNNAGNNLFRNGVFNSLGDILAVPALTEASPFLNLSNGSVTNDEVIERIPQQVMSLLSLSHTPRFVVYAYGQTLKPADRSLVMFGPFSQMCTNYQVTAESASRAVVRVEGLPNNPHLVTESFNVLPPD